MTGSREWSTYHVVINSLKARWGDGTTILLHGACPGADEMAQRIWSSWGGRVEPWPADWTTYGKSAGHRRNADMVNSRLLRVDKPSPGTRGCIDLIRNAAVPLETITSARGLNR